MIEFANARVELLDDFVRDLRAARLVLQQKRGDDINHLLLDLARGHSSRSVLGRDAPEFLVVLEEVEEVLIRNIDFEMSAVLLVLLQRLAAAGEGVLLDLLGRDFRRVSQEDRLHGRVGDRRRHLVVDAAEPNKELGVNRGGLDEAAAGSGLDEVAGQAEVGVLVDRHRHQAAHALGVGRPAEDVGERRRVGRDRLEDGPADLADVVLLGAQPEDALDLVARRGAHHADRVLEEGAADLLGVREDVCLVEAEAARDDVLRVLAAEVLVILEVLDRVLEVVLLVVGHLHDENRVERVLQVLGELEGDHVADVHRGRRRTAARVEINLLALLVRVEAGGEVLLREEEPAAEEAVRAGLGDGLEALDERGVDRGGAELADEFVVVEAADGRGGPRSDFLLAVDAGLLLVTTRRRRGGVRGRR